VGSASKASALVRESALLVPSGRPEIRACPLPELLVEASAPSAAFLQRSGMRLARRADPGLTALADVARTGAVLLALVRNAHRNQRGAGTVELDAWPLGPRWVEIRVSDHGAPMPRSTLERAGELFFSTWGRPGTGLFVATHAASSMGGAIALASGDAGVRASLLLPRAR
jgi:signal transduction histidine kinase